MRLTNFFPRAGRALLLLLALSVLAHRAQAQTGGVGIGTTAPDASAALDIVSSSKGALLPRVAAAAAIATPATGLLVFQTGAPAGFYYNAGSPAAPSWQQLATGNSGGANVTASNGLTKTGLNVALGGSLTTATDVPLNGNTLTFSGTGNVGVGTAAPTTTLEVKGDFGVGTITAGVPMQIAQLKDDGPYGGYDAAQSFTLTSPSVITSFTFISRTSKQTNLVFYAGSGTSGLRVSQPQAFQAGGGGPQTITLTTPLALAAGVYTVGVGSRNVNPGQPNLDGYLDVDVATNTYPADAYPGGDLYLNGGRVGSNGAFLDMYFVLNYTTTTGTQTLYAKDGFVGIGTSSPTQALQVVGTVYSSAGGFRFPDGSTQVTAATPTVTTASNGLTKTGNNTALGGTLGAATSIAQAGYDFSLTDGDVGIGTTAPAGGLHVDRPESATATALGVVLSGGTSGNPSIELRGSSKVPYIDFSETSGVDYTTRLISSGGVLNVGGNGSAGVLMQVNGGLRAVNFANISDRRFKQNIRPLTDALASVLALRGVRYEWNALGVQRGGTAGAAQVGLIAQEIEKIYPELVSTGPDGYKAVNYAQLTPVLIEALKELKAENDALKAGAAADHASLLSLQAQMARLLGPTRQGDTAPATAQARR